MAHNINVTIEDDELALLQLVGRVTDFYGDGYDDHKPADVRPSGKVLRGLIKKIKEAIQQAQP